MESFRALESPDGTDVAELELLLRAAVFKSVNALLEALLQQAVGRIEAACQPMPGERVKGREPLVVQGLFGSFILWRRYYHHAGKKTGRYPADAALGLEGGYTSALARLHSTEAGKPPAMQSRIAQSMG